MRTNNSIVKSIEKSFMKTFFTPLLRGDIEGTNHPLNGNPIEYMLRQTPEFEDWIERIDCNALNDIFSALSGTALQLILRELFPIPERL